MSTAPGTRSIGRRAWYLVMNAVLGAWMVAAIVVVIAHRFVPQSGWLMVHVVMLGVVTCAILIWSQHFADALTRRAAPGGRIGMGARLAAHTAGAVLVIAGMLGERPPLVVAGAALVGVAGLAHAGLLAMQLRGALAARFAGLVRFSAIAAVWLVIGVALGVAVAQLSAGDPVRDRLLVAHVSVMLLGWVGTTVLGTVILFWPTVLRARMRPGDGSQNGTVLAITVLGVAVALLGVATDVRVGVGIGVGIWAAALVLVLIDGVRQARRARAPGFAAMSIGAALAWLGGCVAWFAWSVALASSWAALVEVVLALVQPFVAGFAVQLVLGALSFLLPSVMGHPRARARAERELGRAPVFRVVAVNLGILAYLLPLPSIVRVLLSLFVFGVLASFVVLAVRAVAAGLLVRHRSAPGDVAAECPQARPARPARQSLVAVGVVALAIAGGIALDPAAAGFDVSGTADVEATGETTTLEVGVEGMRFVPDVLEVPRGDRLVVEFDNTGADLHDLTFANGVRSERLNPGEHERVDVGVIGGDLDGWCSVTGHRAMGMELRVEVR